jgi:hypothetical protein
MPNGIISTEGDILIVYIQRIASGLLEEYLKLHSEIPATVHTLSGANIQ